MSDWLSMSAGDLGRGIGKGEIDPVELTEAFLEAIDASELRDRIYARVTHDRARAEAGAARARAQAGQRRSVLDGVPFSWKDLFDTAGVATESGTALLADRIPARDAVVLQNATAMGTVCLGKTHMSELAFSGLGYNPVTETPPNVNDKDAVPGGSSSGAAASVAFGLAPLGVGSDTGGSVRVPAAWNDLVGLKTSSGRLSLEGVVPLCLRFDTVGPLCRTVEDAALAMAAMAGTVAPDLRGASLSGARIGVLKTVAHDDLRDGPAEAFEMARARLEKAGARMIPLDVPELLPAMDLSPVLYAPEAYGLWRDVIEAAPEKMFPQILARFRAGAEVSAPDYVAGWAALQRYRIAWDAATAALDAVIVPSAPNLPPNLQRLIDDEDYYRTENLLTLRNTRIGNLMGLCGLTLPTGVPSCGVTLLGPPEGEEALLRLGVAAEAALRG
ncbi:amidase [Marinibacterium profundimaris]|uniref:Amidase n=1 Tax=Marinibacterium profundimaris TaxID=1679460 RepID=A0A225NJ02_9RHOB|nr:amidase family protein [Marinibacterium profundimaris]OWU73580.1 amidase [Marinibacterium profundimaris]